MSQSTTLYRGAIAHFPSASAAPRDDLAYFADGALIVESEKILAVGDYHELKPQFNHVNEEDHSGKLIVPGLIDSHVHFPQTEMIASYGEQLLQWLESYTFPTENKFADQAYASHIADVFIDQLLRNGTTTALAFSTVHKSACEALFSAATKHNMAFVTGKTCMDRNCPDYLQDSADSAFTDTEALINQWHGNGRNLYAITPRFAPTSTPEQLAALGELADKYPDVFIQTHLSENKDEIEWVKSLYPEHDGYLAVYEHYNLVRKRAVYGHCIHLTEREWQALADKGATIAFCPTSNLFLGSGLFDHTQAQQHHVHVGLASDVGAGTSFNMLKTYGEAYKISQLQQAPIDPLHGLYMMTQGAAVAYELEDEVGNLNPQSYADFVILNPNFDELSSLRIKRDADCADVLFALSMLGDDRSVHATYVAGKKYITRT